MRDPVFLIPIVLIVLIGLAVAYCKGIDRGAGEICHAALYPIDQCERFYP